MAEDKPVYVGYEKYPELQKAAANRSALKAETKDEGTHLLDYWRTIILRRWTVVAVVITSLIISAVWTMKQTPVYQATTQVQVEREGQNIVSYAKDFIPGGDGTDLFVDYTLQSYFKILESRSLARRVVEEMGPELRKEFTDDAPSLVDTYKAKAMELVGYTSAPQPAAVADAEDEPDTIRPIINEYVSRLTISPIRQSWLVNVSFEAKDPKLAAKIINLHANHFIEQNIQNRFDATKKASEFLQGQLVTMKGSLEKADERLQLYSREHQILFTEQGQSTAQKELEQVQTDFNSARSDRIQKESLHEQAVLGRVESLPQVANSTRIQSLSGQASDLRREDSGLADQFDVTWPRRKAIQSQLAEIDRSIKGEQAKIVDTIETEYEAARVKERLLESTLNKQNDVVNKTNQEIIQYNILKREVESNRALYEGLLTRLGEAGVSAGLRASNIRVIDAAEVPRHPVKPRRSLNMALGLLAGLVTGVGLAFFQDYMDSSIKTPDDITKHLKLPILGTVPKIESLHAKRGYGYGRYGYGYGYGSGKKKPTEAESELATQQQQQKKIIELAPHNAPSSIIAEAYRSIRTSLLLASADRPPRVVLVTSALPSEGKTSTAVNTAIALTQTGARVVIIDADMRKPRLHRVLQVQNSVGLSGVLTGTCELKDAITETTVPNLFVIPCGVIPPNPAELILSSRLKSMVQALSGYFDFVVMDSPPLSNVSDGRILAGSCDAAILVVKALSTSRFMANRAAEYLHDAKIHIAGVVLNDLDLRLRSGGYSTYHSKSYSYYYSHYQYYGTTDKEKEDSKLASDAETVGTNDKTDA